MKNFISLYDNAISHEECISIIEYFESLKDCRESSQFLKMYCKKEGLTQKGVDKFVKDSTDVAMSFNKPELFVNQILMKCLAKYTRKYVKENTELKHISTWGILDTYNLQRYYPEQGYAKLHCENCDVKTNKRVLAWMVYLNTVTDEGGTYFSNYDYKIDAVEGRLVIWPAYWTHVHRGVISKSQTKYIATGWYEKIEENTIIRKVRKSL